MLLYLCHIIHSLMSVMLPCSFGKYHKLLHAVLILDNNHGTKATLVS